MENAHHSSGHREEIKWHTLRTLLTGICTATQFRANCGCENKKTPAEWARILHMYCGTLEVTGRHPVPPQLLGGRLPHCCCLFRQEQPSGSQQSRAATISLNASHGGTGDSQSGTAAVYTVSMWLLLTLGNLTGVQLYTKKQNFEFCNSMQRLLRLKKYQ